MIPPGHPASADDCCKSRLPRILILMIIGACTIISFANNSWGMNRNGGVSGARTPSTITATEKRTQVTNPVPQDQQIDQAQGSEVNSTASLADGDGLEVASHTGLDWRESKEWVRERLQAMAVEDTSGAWHGVKSAKKSKAARSALKERQQQEGGTPEEESSGQASAAQRRANAATADVESMAVDAGVTPSALVAVTTTNVWDKTEKMLQSLAACQDNFELLVR